MASSYQCEIDNNVIFSIPLSLLGLKFFKVLVQMPSLCTISSHLDTLAHQNKPDKIKHTHTYKHIYMMLISLWNERWYIY